MDRICTNCKQSKPLSDFYRYCRYYKNPKVNKDRLDTVCKKCKYLKQKERRVEIMSTEIGRRKMKDYYKNYYYKNPELARARRRKYNLTVKGIYNSLCKRRKGEVISQADFIEWYNEQIKICYYCGITGEEAKKHKYGTMSNRLNIDRKDNGKGYIKENIVLACWLCNRVKNDYFTENEMFEIAEIIKRKRKEI